MDIQLFYNEWGSGEALVLLHGNGEEQSYFCHQIPYFSQKYRVIAVDTRGHGKSPRGTAPFTIAQFAEDLLALLDALKVEKAVVLGFSDGANIAMRFALRYPGRVRALILNGGNLSPRGVKARWQIPIELGYRIARAFAAHSEGAKKNAELLGLMVNEPNIAPQELSGINCPTLVIAGERDMIKETHTELIASAITGAELAILPGDHFLANKNHAQFNECVGNFLDKCAL